MKSLIAIASLTLFAANTQAQQTITIPNGTQSFDPAGDPQNIIVTVPATNSFVLHGDVLAVSGTLTEIAPATFGSEARIRIRCSSTPADFADLQLFSTGGFTGTLTVTPGTYAWAGSLIGKQINAGDTLSFEFWESFDDAANAVDAIWNNLVFTLQRQITPPSFTSLGVMVPPGRNVDAVHAAGEVKWYQFSTAVATSATEFLRIHTRNTTDFLGATQPNDTAIALYTNDGVKVTENDNESASIFTSFLQLGNTPVLPAGTYYLAVTGSPLTASDAFAVTSSSTASGTIRTSFITNLGGAGGRAISGRVNLLNLNSDPASFTGNWELISSTGSTLESGTCTFDSDGDYSFVPFADSGTAIMRLKVSHWLSKVSAPIDLFFGSAGVDLSLQNGDCDNDNEVGPGDFVILGSAFGSFLGHPAWNPSADLDHDFEVGPADFTILSNNFGKVGE